MASGSLTKKIINGKPYYYLRFTKRVEGRPKVVRTIYLGRVEEILAAVQKQRKNQRPKRIVLAEFGAIAAVWDMIQQTGLIQLIDAHVHQIHQLAHRHNCGVSAVSFSGWRTR